MHNWEDPNTLITLILIMFGVFVLLVISLFAISYFAFKKLLAAKKRETDSYIEHKNKLIQSNLEVQEKERIRIASELHDGIIGKIAAIRLQLAMQKPVAEVDGQIGDTIDELRRISHDLYPPMYEVQSLNVILKNVLSNYDHKYKIDTHINILDDSPMPLREKIQILRIVQELIHNLEKHAHAKHIWFYLRISTKNVALVLRDDGVGFDIASHKHGQGLQNIELRCMSIGASYKYKSKPNYGTTFILCGQYQ